MASKGNISINEINVYEVDADPTVSGVPALTGSIAIYDNRGFWQKVGPLDTDWAPISLSEKSGSVLAGDFSGNPKTYAVVFTTMFPTNNYSVSITGSDGRSWVAESLAQTGFTINAQANQPLTGLVYWQANYKGETI